MAAKKLSIIASQVRMECHEFWAPQWHSIRVTVNVKFRTHFVRGGSEEEKNEGKGIKNMVNQDISLRKAKKKSSNWRNWFFSASIINLTYHRRVVGRGRNDLNLWFHLSHSKHHRRLLASPVSGRWGKIEFSTCASLHISRREQYFFVIFLLLDISHSSEHSSEYNLL